MLGPDVVVQQPVRLFGGELQHPLGLSAERDLNRSGDLLSDDRAAFDLLSDVLEGEMGTSEDPARSMCDLKRTRSSFEGESRLAEKRQPIDDALHEVNGKLLEAVENHREGFIVALRELLQADFGQKLREVKSRLQSKQLPRLIQDVDDRIDRIKVGDLAEWPGVQEQLRHEKKVLQRMAERLTEELQRHLATLDELQKHSR